MLTVYDIYIYISYFPNHWLIFRFTCSKPVHLLRCRLRRIARSPSSSCLKKSWDDNHINARSQRFFFHGDAMEIYHGIKMGLYGENNHTEISISSCVRENLQEIQSVSHQIWEVPAFFNKLLGTIITWNWNMKRFEWLSGEAVFGALYIHLFWP